MQTLASDLRAIGSIGAALVTGSAGLVGQRVAQLLHEAGVDVLGVDIRPSGGAFPASVADVSDLAAMKAFVEGRPNVVHAGAVSGPMLMLDDPHGIARANLGGAMAVFEACRRVGVRRLVWPSSIAVYGDQPTLAPIAETTGFNPQSFYGHTKVAAEFLLHGYAARYGVPGVALRLSSVFGLGRQTAYGLRAVIEAGLAGKPVLVAAEGTSYRQYMHVDDAAAAILSALAADQIPGFAYNVTGGTWVTEAELARMLADFVPGLTIQQGPPAWNEGHLGPLLIEAAERDLGYRPRVPLRDGLRELAAGYAQRFARNCSGSAS